MGLWQIRLSRKATALDLGRTADQAEAAARTTTTGRCELSAFEELM